jgi:probable F420-dependent oxidoreductase
MRVSLFLPTIHEGRFIPIGGLAIQDIVRLAEVAEELAYDALWIGEFMETQADVSSQFDAPPAYFAPISTLGVLATRTARIGLTTGVLVLPHHDPVVLAREIATLDVISEGRITLGLGLGGSIDDFRRIRRIAPGLNRSDLMEESIAAMRRLWEDRRATWVGKQFEFHDLETFPKPKQSPLPIVIAGGVDAVVERVGRLADGWIDTFSPPAAMRDRLVTLNNAARAAGRGTHPFQVMRSFFCSIAASDEAAERQREESVPGGRPTGRPNSEEREFLLVGSPNSIVRQLQRYAGLGISEVNVAFYHRDMQTGLQQVELFAREVMPALRTLA